MEVLSKLKCKKIIYFWNAFKNSASLGSMVLPLVWQLAGGFKTASSSLSLTTKSSFLPLGLGLAFGLGFGLDLGSSILGLIASSITSFCFVMSSLISVMLLNKVS